MRRRYNTLVTQSAHLILLFELSLALSLSPALLSSPPFHYPVHSSFLATRSKSSFQFRLRKREKERVAIRFSRAPFNKVGPGLFQPLCPLHALPFFRLRLNWAFFSFLVHLFSSFSQMKTLRSKAAFLIFCMSMRLRTVIN